MSAIDKSETIESTILWRIENFSSIDASTGASIRSPIFKTTLPCTKRSSWILKLYPGGVKKESKEYMGLYLRHLGDSAVSVSYSLSILDNEQKVINILTSTCKLFSKRNKSWGTEQFYLKDEIKHLLVNNTLVVLCTIKVTLNDEYSDTDDSVKAHFEKLLESGDLSDVTFKIGDRQMRLHKAIIASISPVFYAMFQHQMKEKEESFVQITDVTYEVMEELFRYIYVRKINNMKNIAGSLLVAADKYDVQGLKIICEKFMSQQLNEKNVLQHLEFAVTYNTTLLKSKAIEFVVGGLEKFVDRPEFERLSAACKDELLRAVAKRNVDNAKMSCED